MPLARDLPTLFLLLFCAVQPASGFRGGAVRVSPVPCTSRSALLSVRLSADGPTSKWTLSQLREYVKDNGLDIKTSGPGRNKAAILDDVQKYLATVGANAAPAHESPRDGDSEGIPDATVDADEERDSFGVPPDGFEWGGTY